ncbi:hypothetical protein NEMBOFW57_004337 [Staphylotrichum longicolle]|uniref:Nephrocystin 3-like N-terminal domain-containing protein n=1 Tax=Staphylotrichum longicolle TaxID=669026 RepID=A0AAD4F6Y9_9PEZI|nr:hypothetical protein NEMBOFW57_004337 [Staphylotrichum longicolle]
MHAAQPERCTALGPSGPGLTFPIVREAEFDSFAEQHNARCYEGTRTELLCQIKNWADDPHGEVIFWLNGMAGAGKSTISRTVAEAFANPKDSRLGASFFFKRGEGNRGNATLFFPTIACQLARKIPALEPYVREAVDTDQAIGKALEVQFDKLILQPLSRIQHAMAVMVVIDALDECDGEMDVRKIIPLLAQATKILSVRLRFFITSRPELPIRLGFRNVQGKYENLALHQIPKPTVERDISAFLEHELGRIRDTYNGYALEELGLPQDWPGRDVIQTLTQMAVPLFIFAATICRFVEDAYSDPCTQLKEVLKYQTKTHDSEIDKLDATYLPVLSQLTVGRLDPQMKRSLTEFRDVVGPIVLLAQPLSMSSLARLLDIPLRAVSNTLNPLHSVLSIPSKADLPIRLFHLSFRDFLVDPTKRAGEFWIDETKYHRILFNRCIQLMRQHLKRDICGLQLPGKLRSDVDQQLIDAALPPDAQYACRYWVYHLKESKSSIQDGDPVHIFLTSHLLHWLESLGLLGHITESIAITEDLLNLLDPADASQLSAFLYDAKRLMLSNWQIIDMAPLQVQLERMLDDARGPYP